MEKITLTKLDVAQRQLRAAIELWVVSGDPIVVHALAFAAHEIIHVLYRKKGHRNLLFDSSGVKEEYRRAFLEALKASANFIKHARNDSDKTLDFEPVLSEVFLDAAIVGLQRMRVSLSDIERAYIDWLAVHHPEWFDESIFKKGVPIEHIEEIRRMPKREFFENSLRLKRKARNN